jgi:hypothetical protein
MNLCLNCGKPVKNKYCNVSCQDSHQHEDRINKRLGEYKIFKVKCFKCGKEFEVKEREKLFPKKEKYFCSRSCANIREHTDEVKNKIRNSVIKFCKEHPKKKRKRKKPKYYKICEYCEQKFETNNKRQKFCSKKCVSNRLREAGIKSANIQRENRRSKNEMYFAELCKKKFKNVLTNIPIFNGWDADVILPDLKIAVLWNGKWHYEKITIKHSVKQVQNRDKIKIHEIKKAGYIPYIIKDMGKYNKLFVEKEFEKFKKYCEV